MGVRGNADGGKVWWGIGCPQAAFRPSPWLGLRRARDPRPPCDGFSKEAAGGVLSALASASPLLYATRPSADLLASS